MLDFTCPSCKTSWQAANDFAGKSILCPKCGQTATVPAADPTQQGITTTPTGTPLSLPPLTAVTTPEEADAAHRAKSKWDDDNPRPRSIMKDGGAAASWVRIGVYTVLGVTVFVVLVALLVPATQKVHVGSARTQSINNLRQIGMACQGFHDVNKRLPFNGAGPAIASDCTSGSWAFQVNPYISDGAMFVNPQGHRGASFPVYMCPGRGRPHTETTNGGGPWTDYFFNNYLNDPNQAENPKAPDMQRTLVSITDGTSNTVLAGHGNIRTSQYASNANVTLSVNIFVGGTAGSMRSGNNGKHNPGGVTLKRDSDEVPTIGSWGGPFSQGALMCMADGSVHLFPYATQNFGAFLTPTGNEGVAVPD